MGHFQGSDEVRPGERRHYLWLALVITLVSVSAMWFAVGLKSGQPERRLPQPYIASQPSRPQQKLISIDGVSLGMSLREAEDALKRNSYHKRFSGHQLLSFELDGDHCWGTGNMLNLQHRQGVVTAVGGSCQTFSVGGDVFEKNAPMERLEKLLGHPTSSKTMGAERLVHYSEVELYLLVDGELENIPVVGVALGSPDTIPGLQAAP